MKNEMILPPVLASLGKTVAEALLREYLGDEFYPENPNHTRLLSDPDNA